MEKTYTFQNETGVFVCFNEFPNEDDFEKFLEYLHLMLDVLLEPPQISPYSITTQFIYSGVSVDVMFDGETGCCIRTEKDNELIFKKILEKLKIK